MLQLSYRSGALPIRQHLIMSHTTSGRLHVAIVNNGTHYHMSPMHFHDRFADPCLAFTIAYELTSLGAGEKPPRLSLGGSALSQPINPHTLLLECLVGLPGVSILGKPLSTSIMRDVYYSRPWFSCTHRSRLSATSCSYVLCIHIFCFLLY